MNKRAVILSTAIVFGFAVVILRLAGIMLLDHERLSRAARLQQVRDKEVGVARGVIFDRRGRELAVNIETESLYCEPRKMTSPETAVRVVSAYTGLRPADLSKMFSSDKGFAWVRRKLDPEVADKIRRLDMEGIGFKTELKRFYPNGMLFSHVVGSVGVDNQPLEALELKYDDVIGKSAGRASADKVMVLRDAGGSEMSGGIETQVKGNNIVLTIDEGLQYIADSALGNAVLKWKASHAVAIMMNPYTGEVLAMANRPTYDPNRPSEFGTETKRNRAITDLYEPGSTFKLVTAAAALEEGTVRPNSVFDCSRGEIRIGKHTIRDAHKHGVLTFREVVQKSSNVGFINAGLKLGGGRLSSYAKRFGFGEKTGLDLPGEAPGWVSSASSDISAASLSIGYGAAVTPLQVLRAYSAVANGGYLMTPYVVSEIRTPEGDTVYFHKPEQSRRAISRSTAETLREILVSVTEEGGTAFGASVDGNRVAGKTGTAMMRDEHGYSKQKYASSFVGFVPADDPKLALIVVVFEPKGAYYGGAVAAPVFKEIAEKSLAYLNVPRDDTVLESVLTVKAERNY